MGVWLSIIYVGKKETNPEEVYFSKKNVDYGPEFAHPTNFNPLIFFDYHSAIN